MKTLLSLFLAALLPAAQAADSYGYIAFWQNPDKPEVVTVTQTTRENASLGEARAELNAFCREQDKQLNPQSKAVTGCLSVTALHNTCAAAAWPRAQGLLKHENVVVVQNPKFKKAAPAALEQCRLKYGEAAGCEIETVFCTSTEFYGTQSRLAEMWRKLTAQ